MLAELPPFDQLNQLVLSHCSNHSEIRLLKKAGQSLTISVCAYLQSSFEAFRPCNFSLCPMYQCQQAYQHFQQEAMKAPKAEQLVLLAHQTLKGI